MTDEQIRGWAYMASKRGGSFVQAIGTAVLAADDLNFALIWPVVEKLVEKYPKYLEWWEAEQARTPA